MSDKYVSTAKLAKSMGLSKVRIGQLVKQLADEDKVSVGEIMGTCRMFSPADADVVRSMYRRDYTK